MNLGMPIASSSIPLPPGITDAPGKTELLSGPSKYYSQAQVSLLSRLATAGLPDEGNPLASFILTQRCDCVPTYSLEYPKIVSSTHLEGFSNPLYLLSTHPGASVNHYESAEIASF